LFASDWSLLFRHGRGPITALIALAVGLHAMDVFIVSTVMPTVVADIGGVSFYAWPTTIYMVASILGAASGGPLNARLGARYSQTLAGAIFLIGTLGCGIAPAMAPLILGRAVQGFGGGLLMAQALVLVSRRYEGPARTRMLAAVAGAWTVAALLGPLIGGLFAELGWWRGAFIGGTPLIIGFCGLAWRVLPPGGAAADSPAFPIRRMGLLAGGVICVAAADQFATVAAQISLLVAAGLLLALCVRLDAGAGAAGRLFPSRPLSLNTPVGTAYWIFFLQSVTHSAIGVFLPLLLQTVHGETALVAGYLNAVLAVTWTLGSFLTAGWRGRGEAWAPTLGMLVATLGMAALAWGAWWLPPFAIAIAAGTVGFGFGAANLHLTAATMHLARPGEESITASSMTTVRLLGVAFGAAASGVIANAAGLGHGVNAATVATAVANVYALTALAPGLCVLLTLNFLRLRQRQG
jgi:MFS family permease